MQKEEQEKFELLIEAVNKIQEFKNIIVKTKEFELAPTVRDLEKKIHQSFSDFFNTKKTFSSQDLCNAFDTARSGLSHSSQHANDLMQSSTYRNFEEYFKSVKTVV